MNKILPFIFLVELSEKIDEPFVTTEGMFDEIFAFSYKVNITPKIVDLTNSGKSAVTYLEEQTIRDLYYQESLDQYRESLMEIVHDQLNIFSFVLFTTKIVIQEMEMLLERDVAYRNRFETFLINPDKPSMYDTIEYYIGIPTELRESGYANESYRVRFITDSRKNKVSG